MTSNYTKTKRSIGRAHKASMDLFNDNRDSDGIEIVCYGVKIKYTPFSDNHTVNGKQVTLLDLEHAFYQALMVLEPDCVAMILDSNEFDVR